MLSIELLPDKYYYHVLNDNNTNAKWWGSREKENLTGVIVISSLGDRLMVTACLSTWPSLHCDNDKDR